ncbi:hypothetical protein [Bacillus sp. JJ722]|uniref:hypothetical protein n=1 Tax=Bacillus sp. JJ722 TaxID=3122973 RepID=UPI002FFEF2A0
MKSIVEENKMDFQSTISKNKTEFYNYVTFLQEHFPKNVWIQEENLIKLEHFHNLIFENLVIYDLINEHLNNHTINTQIRFVNDYMESINTLLIALPVNYPGFANYNIRVASESLLKYIYSLTFSTKTEEEVARTQFRYLKDEPKRAPENAHIREEIIKLTSIYGKASKIVHKHKIDTSNLSLTINYYVDTFFEELSDIIQILDDIIIIFMKTILNKTNFNYNNTSFSTKLRIQSKLSSHKFHIIKSM